MAANLILFNLDGSVKFDIGTRLARKLAEIQYGSVNGSAGFSRRPLDLRVVAVASGRYPPTFTVDLNANVISWDFSLVPANVRFGGTVELWAT